MLGIVSITLILVFRAQVNALIALYAIGVFTGFTLAGAGMVARHRRERTGRWRLGVAINATSASVTAIVVLVFIIAKFTEGAWIIVVVGPLMYWGLMRFHHQYEREVQAFEETAGTEIRIRTNRVVIFIDHYDLATERALSYCKTLNPYSIRAVHFDIDPMVTKRLEARWGAAHTASFGINLEIAECEDRRVDRAALELVADVVRDPDVFCMVILPRRGYHTRLQRLLHDQTANTIAAAVMHVPRTAATIIPYRMGRSRVVAERDRDVPLERRGRARRRARRRPPRRRRPARRTIGRRRAHRRAARATERRDRRSHPIDDGQPRGRPARAALRAQRQLGLGDARLPGPQRGARASSAGPACSCAAP